MPMTKFHFELTCRVIRGYSINNSIPPPESNSKPLPQNIRTLSSTSETSDSCEIGKAIDKDHQNTDGPLDMRADGVGNEMEMVTRKPRKPNIRNVHAMGGRPISFIRPIMQRPQFSYNAELLSKKTSTYYLLQNIRSMSDPCRPICCCGGDDNSSGGGSGKALTLDNLNPNIIKLEYAVRGPLVIRALEIEKEILKGAQKPFKTVIKANIGDAHAMGQKPITFIRQIMQRPQFSYNAELLSKKTSTYYLLQNIRSMSDPCRPICCCGGDDNSSGGGSGKALTLDNLNPNIIKLEYAVRGPLVIRALEIEKEILKGAQKPFKTVIKANIGDAHAMGQKPITFIRQVLACTLCPSLIKSGGFPEDVRARATDLLANCGGKSIGAYTASYGIEKIRKNIAAYIKQRDGHPSKAENVCLCGGASSGIRSILQLFCNNIDGKKSGVMIPIPQYPLYSATIAEYGLEPVSYYLNEERGWALELKELERSYNEGSDKCNVRAIVVINPGNPTGQVLTRENVETIVKFAQKKQLFILADEVYQHNVYAKGCQFHSFKKVISDLGDPYNKIELASFMSASKCYMGECGIRGGWMELVNMDPDVQANLYKALSARLCPSALGQVVMDCVVRHPVSGDPSYELFTKERTNVLQSLANRAQMVYDIFNKMEGFSCNVVQGAMYAFPQIKLPPKAIEAAEQKKKKPDVFYAFSLLEETGICIIPGSGFGQKPGTWHFRTTILPQPDLLKLMLETFQKFHDKFTKQYSA